MKSAIFCCIGVEGDHHQIRVRLSHDVEKEFKRAFSFEPNRFDAQQEISQGSRVESEGSTIATRTSFMSTTALVRRHHA